MATNFLKPGGGFGGAEAPVRRAIEIGLSNGLTADLDQAHQRQHDLRSPRHPGPLVRGRPLQRLQPDAADGRDGQGDRDGARPSGVPRRVLNVTHGTVRAQLIWRHGANHLNHVHIGMRVSGNGRGPAARRG